MVSATNQSVSVGSARPFGVRVVNTLGRGKDELKYFDIAALKDCGVGDPSQLPRVMKIWLEMVLRLQDGEHFRPEHVRAFFSDEPLEIPWRPGRVLGQDYTGVPLGLDFIMLQRKVAAAGGDYRRVHPLIPYDLVVDHSVQVDQAGTPGALAVNTDWEFRRNVERYGVLRHLHRHMKNVRVVPPKSGICHQVNCEFLAGVVTTDRNSKVSFFDTCVGTDSHTTMVNGMGVLGWGVGGIEATANLLGVPTYQPKPKVVGVKLIGSLPEGSTATDLALYLTQRLRKHGVVDKMVEFYGPGVQKLRTEARLTVANMAPEYGATCGYFPIDNDTLRYLELTGRSKAQVRRVKRYAKAQGLWHDPDVELKYDESIEFDMATVRPTLAGPSKPQQRVSIGDLPGEQLKILASPTAEGGYGIDAQSLDAKVKVTLAGRGEQIELGHGDLAIAAITSCTNTSNPAGLVLAALVAQAAVARGLKVRPGVKTSFAPGSGAVQGYLESAGLLTSLEALGFHIAALGCTTCIGNSGPLDAAISAAVKEYGLKLAAVLSGNRNFTGRVNPDVALNYLGSPGLVVAYALAGTTRINLDNDPIGVGSDGRQVYLRDIWPTQERVDEIVAQFVTRDVFVERYGKDFLEGPDQWRAVEMQQGDLFEFDAESTYIEMPPWCDISFGEQGGLSPITGARALLIAGVGTTTDHISPAGSFSLDSPAGKFLVSRGIEKANFNSLGARRGSHRVMGRATFGSPTLVNRMLPDAGGKRTCGMAVDTQSGETLPVWDLAERFRQSQTPAVVLAEGEYGTGSSRDWAAKGVVLQGVRAVIAESFERIHRSNLALMGVLPLLFTDGQTWKSLGLDGTEEYHFPDLTGIKPSQEIELRVVKNGAERTIRVKIDLRTESEIATVRAGGILPQMLQKMLKLATA